MKNGYVYQLVCPMKKQPIYVGATVVGLTQRLHAHLASIKKSNLPLYIYLRDNAIIPFIELLETVPHKELKLSEHKWLNAKIAEGYEMFNLSNPKKFDSGSIKIDPYVYKELWDYCEKHGIKITFFATESIRKNLQEVKNVSRGTKKPIE